ncbi:MAG: 3-deoxy-D-manno-octulosonic acid transferase [Phenylobacterium sp.]|uniref:3-deoxy-D-manno-octulosonic acid transferase n=1 Tax=Phenylobacterium sp. TaxID=1871053 RepID=UPI0027319CB2|nr:3-deoxy-D-manno-octulosonic acid transferase [Phenylobacterium sp.]MDP2010047.1 3-deoxy-D-manno-octulosonic acid transferase [Phenylobacterium sp.]
MRRPLSLQLYAAALGLLEPLAGPLLARRVKAGKEDAARLGERLGHANVTRPEGRLVWLHGVSVGESMSLLPLVSALKARRPELALLVTSGTRTSAELLAKRLPAQVIHQYIPLDAPGAVRRFLDHWEPDLGVLVESELWPNLILGAHERRVKLALLSARMTEGSAQGWAKVPAAAKLVLDAFDLIAPQETETQMRLKRLGARTSPLLNLKTVGEALPVDAAELARLKTAVGDRRVVLAANTHPGEDEIVIQGFRQAGLADTLLVIAPRHPARGEAIAGLLAGFEVARRAAGEPLTAQTTAYVADTLGEMGLLYSLADVVVMGGSFLPGIGGHNPLEPARLEKPILTGPHTFNATSLYADLFAQAAAIEAADSTELARHLRGLATYPHIGRRMGEAALAYADRQGGALDQAMTLLEPLLPA